MLLLLYVLKKRIWCTEYGIYVPFLETRRIPVDTKQTTTKFKAVYNITVEDLISAGVTKGTKFT